MRRVLTLGSYGNLCLSDCMRTDTTPQTDISASQFADYFRDKVELTRSSSAGPAAPVICQQCQQLSLTAYSPVDVSDVLRTLSQSPNKHCVLLDPLPTWRYSLVCHECWSNRSTLQQLRQLFAVYACNETEFTQVILLQNNGIFTTAERRNGNGMVETRHKSRDCLDRGVYHRRLALTTCQSLSTDLPHLCLVFRQ